METVHFFHRARKRKIRHLARDGSANKFTGPEPVLDVVLSPV